MNTHRIVLECQLINRFNEKKKMHLKVSTSGAGGGAQLANTCLTSVMPSVQICSAHDKAMYHSTFSSPSNKRRKQRQELQQKLKGQLARFMW